MKIYLHIGYPKTGSTAIQWHVSANRRWFEERGVYVPRTGFWSGLGHAYLVKAGDADVSAECKHSLAELANELDHCSREGFKSALLTWEGFALAGPSSMAALGEALAEHDLEVLAYVRDQASLFQSLVLQSIKTLQDFSQIGSVEEGTLVGAPPQYLDFNAVLARWESNLPAQTRVRTRLFDRRSLLEGDVVVDFLSLLELELDSDFCIQSENINRSLSVEGALHLISALSAGLDFGGLIRLSQALVAAQWSGRSKQFLTSEGVQQIQEHYAAGNSLFFERYRPENFEHDSDGFSAPPDPKARAEAISTIEYLREVQRLLNAPEIVFWGGEHLLNKNVGRLVAPPSHGWRKPEKTGVWSIGKSSELRFFVPSTHRRCGPAAIRLMLEGMYFEDHDSTRVTYGECSEVMDLRNGAVITVPIDESVSLQGVNILLEHQFSKTLLGKDDVNQRIAYKLTSACYDFVWE